MKRELAKQLPKDPDPRRTVARRACARSACLVGTEGFQYGELRELSENGASFITEGSACLEPDVQVLFEIDRERFLCVGFQRVWSKGNRVGGRWTELPLPIELFARLLATPRAA